MSHNVEDIKRTMRLIGGPAWECGDVVELRALGADRKDTVSGYFDAEHEADLIAEAGRCGRWQN